MAAEPVTPALELAVAATQAAMQLQAEKNTAAEVAAKLARAVQAHDEAVQSALLEGDIDALRILLA